MTFMLDHDKPGRESNITKPTRVQLIVWLVTAVVVITAAWIVSHNSKTDSNLNVSFVSSSEVLISPYEAEFQVQFDITARGHDVLINGWPLSPGKGPADVEFEFFGNAKILDWTGTVSHTGATSDDGRLLVRKGETERFTLTVNVQRVETSSYVGIAITGLRWQTPNNSAIYSASTGTKGGNDFTTNLIFVASPDKG